MFAILVSNENRPKIEEVISRSERESDWTNLEPYVQDKDYYMVQGWYNATVFMDWTVLPGYIIRESFEYDADVIKTDWDQIVRIAD